ncbi:MAG: pyridoxamine 5'-phosphate oxidase family protein [Chitinophagales bacterium]|nr:pyridoxamine 5'-phosphate oxidase family protein [Hyphomicrobiales bacterium]
MQPNVPPPYYNDLSAALGYAFGQMAAALSDRRSGFHSPTVATLGLDGFPKARTVIIRHFDKAARTVGFHTDKRSRKWLELQRNPHLALHGYDAGRKLQLRFQCDATLHYGDEIAHSAWKASRVMSRACYAQALAPGAAMETPDAASANAIADSDAFENFAVVRAKFHCIEWLYLAAQGHRRAEFSWADDSLTARWLAP